MENNANFIVGDKDGERYITIHPVNKHLASGDLYATGVYRLTYGDIGLGEIVFDDDMNQWEYTGVGDLMHHQAAEIAHFIKNYKDDGEVGESELQDDI